MEYCIAVANGALAATATGLNISDPLPTTVTYDGTYGIFVDGTVSGGVCASNGTAGGSYSASPFPTISGALANLAAGQSGTLRFRVKIN